MSASAILMMVAICGLIWGGFTLMLSRAVRKEGQKASDRIDEHPPHPSP